MEHCLDDRLRRSGALVGGKFMEFFFPSVLMAASISLSLIVDSIIVSNILGEDALGAINLIIPITLCFTAVSGMFGIGSASCISMFKGKLDPLRADKCLSLSCLAWLLCSAVGVLLGLFCTPQISAFLSGDSGLEELVARYLRVYLLGSPFTFITLIFPYIIKADGQPKLSANALIVANATNLVLDLVYMGLMDMGIAGGALATITGNAVGSCLYVVYIMSKGRTLRLAKLARGDFRLYGDMFRMSVSSIFGQALMFAKIWIFNMIVTSTAGKEGLAAFSICSFCLSFVSLFIAGGAQTMMPMISAFNGARDFSAIRLTMRKALKIILLCCVGVTLLFELFPGAIMTVYGIDDALVLELGMTAVRLFSLAFVGIGFSFMFMYYVQSNGRPAFAMQICALEGFIIIVPVCLALSRVLGSEGIWLSYSINEILVAAFIILRSRHTVAVSGGRLSGLFMLEEPEQPWLELSVDVSDGELAAAACEALDAFACEHYGAENAAELAGLALGLSHRAYCEKPGRKRGENVDVVAREGRLLFKDMGRDYALLSEAPELERLKDSGCGYENTLMIGMNYSNIGLKKEAANGQDV